MTVEQLPEHGHWVDVVLPSPSHSSMGALLTYCATEPIQPGTLVRVPLGKREVTGVAWNLSTSPPADLPTGQIRPVQSVLGDIPPLDAHWRRLMAFAAQYYQRGLGEMALAALPPALREVDASGLQRRMKRRHSGASTETPATDTAPATSAEQAQALVAMAQSDRPCLLFGATGSGKTEVYLRAVADMLARDGQSQALVMVPEINLTPQLEARFVARFGTALVTTLHSGLTPAQRLRHWLRAHLGEARIVLGTRMAVLASLPYLRLIVVDEEHDASYKSQEGARYSARDLAVYRGHLLNQADGPGCRVLLGSATPSLESWQAALLGKYVRLDMPTRMGEGCLPRLRLLDMHQQPRHCVVAPPLVAAMASRAARGEQSLVLLNRRGYAPVLTCHDCGWTSDCPHCSAHTVFHKADRSLRCHHCGLTQRVPRACPDCGNLDIAAVGRGTEQLEEQLVSLLADARRPDGQPVRVGRLDADTTRTKGSLAQQLAQMHDGTVDVLVGTQMVAKGHDFRRITLVASLNTDNGLFASDYRAPERLFALLMQAAGRAGRDAGFVSSQGTSVEVWVQTWYPQHPLFQALARHDYPGFAATELAQRQAAAMPPFAHQALVRAEARTQAVAQAWLQLASEASAGLPGRDRLTIYPPVPMAVPRVANVERAQMLVESPSRPALQAFLTAWQPSLHRCRQDPATHGLLRWAIDVDPLSL